MNLTVAITIQGSNGQLIGPSNGCPILYLRGSDDPNDDAYNALTSDEFYSYLLQNKCFANVGNYTDTKIYVSYYATEDEVKYINTTLQDAWTFDYLKESGNRLPALSWVPTYNALKYIWDASFPSTGFPVSYDGDLNEPTSINEIIEVYNKVKEKFSIKLTKNTFIQSINSWLQRREKFNLTEHNISYIIEQITEILNLGDNN